jgi:hypothetical protein
MTTLELEWADLFLGDTHYYSEVEDPGSFVLQWHTAASTLYLLSKENAEIDLRLEREIYCIEVYLIRSLIEVS